jgi:formiminoglutamase
LKHFVVYSKQDILNHTRLRRYETKIGEKLKVAGDANKLSLSLSGSTAKYVLFGIPECIGVVANFGQQGTETGWPLFVEAFVNIQSTDQFCGDEMMLLGAFDFSDVMQVISSHSKSREEKVDACRHAVANIIDEEVEELVKIIVAAGKVPVVIGGGHNNSYPLLKGTAKALFKSGQIAKAQINAVNVDAHADYRIMEGRHSGNGFRYAMEESFLAKYAIVGLHGNYNPQSMLDDLYSNVNIQYTFFEDIFLHEKLNMMQALAQAFGFTEEHFTGVELDMDAIEHIPASAAAPCGISVMQARQYMNFAGHHSKVAYVHICEGGYSAENGMKNPLFGKQLATLVSDFIRAALSGK